MSHGDGFSWKAGCTGRRKWCETDAKLAAVVAAGQIGPIGLVYGGSARALRLRARDRSFLAFVIEAFLAERTPRLAAFGPVIVCVGAGFFLGCMSCRASPK